MSLEALILIANKSFDFQKALKTVLQAVTKSVKPCCTTPLPPHTQNVTYYLNDPLQRLILIFAGRSKTTSQLEAIAKLPWYRGVTCKDVRDILPTVLILLGGLLIMIFVIPYAFSSVIKQLEAEQVRECRHNFVCC